MTSRKILRIAMVIFPVVVVPIMAQAADPTGNLTFQESLHGLKVSIDF